MRKQVRTDAVPLWAESADQKLKKSFERVKLKNKINAVPLKARHAALVISSRQWSAMSVRRVV